MITAVVDENPPQIINIDPQPVHDYIMHRDAQPRLFMIIATIGCEGWAIIANIDLQR